MNPPGPAILIKINLAWGRFGALALMVEAVALLQALVNPLAMQHSDKERSACTTNEPSL